MKKTLLFLTIVAATAHAAEPSNEDLRQEFEAYKAETEARIAESLSEKVANGTLTEEQAAEILDGLHDRLVERFESPVRVGGQQDQGRPGGRPGQGGPGGQSGPGGQGSPGGQPGQDQPNGTGV